MFTKRLSIAVAIISVCVGSNLAWSNRAGFAGAPASEPKIDFDQVFADAGWRGGFTTLMGGMSINRNKKGDRSPARNLVILESVRLPYCDRVAAPYADPGLGRIVSRCSA